MKALWTTKSDVCGVGAELVILQPPRFVMLKSPKAHKLELVWLVVAHSQAHQNNYDILFSEWNIPSQHFFAAGLAILALVVSLDLSTPILFLDIKRD